MELKKVGGERERDDLLKAVSEKHGNRQAGMEGGMEGPGREERGGSEERGGGAGARGLSWRARRARRRARE
eukprot:6110558-Pleurochrysis_carterae.AAC.2